MTGKRLVFAVGLALALIASQSGAVEAHPPAVADQVAALDHDRIIQIAGAAMAVNPPAITDHVATNSAGGPHDFFSQADYAWPNPTNQSGLPYVERDGLSKPNTFIYHRLAMRQMKDAVAALAAAYGLTGEDRYVSKATEFLRVFFLDPATRMNPNLQYAQAVLGSSTGRSYGIIDTLHLAELPMAIKFLEKSPTFPASLDQGLKQWFRDYTHWILTSTNGMKEMNAENNHSIACFVQLASYAKFTGDETTLAMARERFKTVLLPRQMSADGSFPLELKRTKPYGYSIFQADNVSILCDLLSTTNDDLWQFTLPDGRTPRAAVDFIYPYLADKGKWLADRRGKDVLHWDDWPVRQPCLLFAYAKFGDEKYSALWEQLNADPTDAEVRRNMAITQPLLWVAHPEDIPLKPLPFVARKLANDYKTNGLIFFEYGQWSMAISNLQKCVEFNPDDVTAYDALGAAYFVKGDLDNAILNYTREIALNPVKAMAWLNRGNAWRGRLDFDKAIADFDECLRLQHGNSMVFKCRAAAWLGKHDYDHAIADLSASLALRGDDASVWIDRGDTYTKLARFDLAVKDYQQAMAVDPQNPTALNDYAWFASTCAHPAVRNGAAAVTAATKACTLAKWKTWEFLDTLAAAYAEAGDFAQATNYEHQAMSRVLTSDPAKKEMLQHLLEFEEHKAWRE